MSKIKTRKRGEKSTTVGRENRARIFLTIFKNQPITFQELLDSKLVSRGALSIHLKALRKDSLIEKTFEGNRIVYKLPYTDEETMLAQLKIGFFDSFTEILSRIFPSAKEGIEDYLKSLAKEMIQYRKDVFEYGAEEAEKRFKERSKQKEKKPLELKPFLTNNEEGEKS